MCSVTGGGTSARTGKYPSRWQDFSSTSSASRSSGVRVCSRAQAISPAVGVNASCRPYACLLPVSGVLRSDPLQVFSGTRRPKAVRLARGRLTRAHGLFLLAIEAGYVAAHVWTG
jgi:hypothetical protein